MKYCTSYKFHRKSFPFTFYFSVLLLGYYFLVSIDFPSYDESSLLFRLSYLTVQNHHSVVEMVLLHGGTGAIQQGDWRLGPAGKYTSRTVI